MSSEWLTAAREPKRLPAVLAGYEVPGLLVQLMRKKASGRLTLTVGEVERSVQLMQGVISSVASKSDKEHLVKRLAGKRRLNKKQDAAVQELMQKENLRFGAALAKMKLVDAEMFADMLAEHHAFLLGRCIHAKAVRCVLDTTAKGPADRAPVKFLEAVEQALRGLSLLQQRSLRQMMTPLVLTLGKEEAQLLNRLDPSTLGKRIANASSPNGVKATALMDQAGGRQAAAALQALFLCGLLKPTEESLLIKPSSALPYVLTAVAGFAAGVATGAYLTRATAGPAPLPECPAPVVAEQPASPEAPPVKAPDTKKTRKKN